MVGLGLAACIGLAGAAQPNSGRGATACRPALNPQTKERVPPAGLAQKMTRKTSPSHAVPAPRINSHSRRDTSERHMQAICASADRLPTPASWQASKES